MSNHAPFVPWMHSLLDRMKELYNKPNARTIAEALPDITGALHYRGTKATVADLPSSGNTTGDVWHITADGSEWAWDGSEWQDLGGGSVTSVNGKTGAVVLNADDVGGTQESLKLTATPTAGPSGNALMRGTWSGATWQQVVAAVQNSRLIQIDVATVGKITLLYNLGSETNVVSNTVPYAVNGVLYTVVVELFSHGGDNTFMLLIISAPTKNVLISSTTPTIEPQSDTIYNCGKVASLTISNPPATGAYSIVFTSGSTATTTTIPATILGLEDFAAEANTLYEINVLDNRAVIGSWAVSV